MSEEKRRRLASGAHTPEGVSSEVVPGCRGLGPRSSSKLLHANRLRKSHLGAEGGADTFGGKRRLRSARRGGDEDEGGKGGGNFVKRGIGLE